MNNNVIKEVSELGEYKDNKYYHKYFKYTNYVDNNNETTFYHTYEEIDAPWNCGGDLDMSGLNNLKETDYYTNSQSFWYEGTSATIPNACINCPNHPSNGGSGICHCTLGMIHIT